MAINRFAVLTGGYGKPNAIVGTDWAFQTPRGMLITRGYLNRAITPNYRRKKTNYFHLMQQYYGREVSTMYVMQCAGGYAVPLKGGRYQVVGMRATVDSTTSSSRVVLCDDSGLAGNAKWGRVLSSTTPYDYTTNVVDTKGIANVDGHLEVLYPEALMVRHGLSAVVTDNIIPGSLIVYIR